MSYRTKIALSTSFALTAFFVLPWLSLAGDDRYLQLIGTNGVGGGRRLFFLMVTVFVSCMVHFYYNFFWCAQPEEDNGWRSAIVRAINNIILSFALSVLTILSSIYLFDFQKGLFAFIIFRNLLIGGVVVLVVHGYRIMEKSKREELKVLQLKNEIVAQELALLKKQFDPHFLFNSLSSLTGVIRKDQREAIQFVEHLSDIFRYVMDHQQAGLCTVKEELSFVRSYLYLLNIRFGNALEVKFELPDVTFGRHIARFALQLLIENAIKHNILSRANPLTIRIRSDGDVITVGNIVQPRPQVMRGHGIGLAALTKHYGLLGNNLPEINRTENEFTVSLPLL